LGATGRYENGYLATNQDKRIQTATRKGEKMYELQQHQCSSNVRYAIKRIRRDNIFPCENKEFDPYEKLALNKVTTHIVDVFRLKSLYLNDFPKRKQRDYVRDGITSITMLLAGQADLFFSVIGLDPERAIDTIMAVEGQPAKRMLEEYEIWKQNKDQKEFTFEEDDEEI
jgi:hypothetical protein